MKRIVLSVIAVFVLAYIVRELLYHGARKSTGGEFEKLTTVFLDSNDYNAVYLGSSRTEAHFNPAIIDSITRLNSYNLGMEGASMSLALTVLKAYLVHSKKPSYVIVNVEYVDVPADDSIVYRFPRYFPYLANPELYNGLKKIDPRFILFRWMPFYSMPYYNQNYLSASVRSLAGYTGGEVLQYKRGYAMLDDRKLDQPVKEVEGSYYGPSSSYYPSLDSLAAFCSSQGINVVFVSTPLYLRVDYYKMMRNQRWLKRNITNVAQRHRVLFLDYTEDIISFNEELFHDHSHLNGKGSALFSRKFASDLKQYLSK